MNIFTFISDKNLRETLDNSLEYLLLLVEETKNDNKNELFREETYRVIILYVISIIEAIFLYFYKVCDEKIEKIEYKFIQNLPREFCYKYDGKNNLPIIIAVQEKTELKDQEITMQKLVNFFKDKKMVQKKTAKDILELNGLRNTFHFSKPRLKKCNRKRVDEAIELLIHTIERAPVALKVK